MVKGQFVSIDEGNRTERVLIGLGAGRTGLQASVQVYEITPEGMRNVESLQADAKSSYKSGMALMNGRRWVLGHRQLGRQSPGQERRQEPGTVLRDPGVDLAGGVAMSRATLRGVRR